MPNEHAIYLHDTPNKAAFNRETPRALSHGCVRVENIAELASPPVLGQQRTLDDRAGESPTRTKVLQLQRTMPVYIVYFTAQADRRRNASASSPDPYASRPDQLVAQLGGMAGRHASAHGSALRR